MVMICVFGVGRVLHGCWLCGGVWVALGLGLVCCAVVCVLCCVFVLLFVVFGLSCRPCRVSFVALVVFLVALVSASRLARFLCLEYSGPF